MIIAPGRGAGCACCGSLPAKPLGTFFLPRKRLYHGKKLWLANLPKPVGELVLDEGAVTALQKRGKSLLPIGVREVRGIFGVGAPVRCLNEGGRGHRGWIVQLQVNGSRPRSKGATLKRSKISLVTNIRTK